MDGVVIAQQTVIVVLGITRAGHKEPLGLRVGSTENAVVCTELLQDLLARGLALDGRVLCVIDGGKGLRKALGDGDGSRRGELTRHLDHAIRGEACAPRGRGPIQFNRARRPWSTLCDWMSSGAARTAPSNSRSASHQRPCLR